MDTATHTPRKFIEQIRREYGVGVEHTGPDRFKDIASGILPLVTEELYESDAHFFSELLQNADDNEYPINEVPSLVLRSFPDRLELINNENGFTPQQVDAICSAAKSTKRDRKQTTEVEKGATGEKGVGFKAVFQVSDRPEIHSNGFHFRFDKTNHGPFGVVIPEWIGTNDARKSGTRIVLPLRDGYKLPNDFVKSIQPELLLFLRRIRRLEFVNEDYEKTVILKRIDNGDITTVVRSVIDKVDPDRNTTQTHTFFVQRLHVDMSDIDEPRRRMITSSEVAIALALDDKGDFKDHDTRRKLFAFLPVKDTSLPFPAHADFVVVTSREGIRESREWNVRLRDALGECLAKGIMSCRDLEHPGSTALRALIDPKHITEVFLRPIVEHANDNLRNEDCVPVLGGGWARPGESVLTDTNGLWKLVPQGDAIRLLNRTYVDPMAMGISDPLVRLGVTRFCLDTLIRCIRDDEWRKLLPMDWYSQLYATLGKLDLSDKKRDLVRDTPMLPLAGGDVVAATMTNVFRSLGQTRSYGFESELQLIATEALKCTNQKDASYAEAFLRKIGVTDATPIGVIDKYIVPLHQGEKWKECDEAVLTGQLHYIRDNLDTYISAKSPDQRPIAAKQLGSVLWLKTTHNVGDTGHFSKVSRLYLGKDYGDEHDLQLLLGQAIADKCISREYLNAEVNRNSGNPQQLWRSFFVKLGVRELPPVERGSEGDYKWPKEVEMCLSSADSARTSKLIRLIAENWSIYYSRFAFRSRPSSVSKDACSMLVSLRQTLVPVREGESLLSKCFVATEDNQAVFGPAVPFLTFNIGNEFAEDLGVVTAPTVSHALDRLQELQHKKIVDEAIVAPLYKYLDSRFGQHNTEIKSAFHDAQLVLADTADGLTWMNVAAVCWIMPRELRQFLPTGSLSQTWRELQCFFCKHMGVAETLGADDYVEALSQASNQENVDVVQASRIAQIIYSRLRGFASDAAADVKWLQRLREEPLLFTNKGEWWRNDQDVFAADDISLGNLFASSDSVAFIDLGAVQILFRSFPSDSR